MQGAEGQHLHKSVKRLFSAPCQAQSCLPFQGRGDHDIVVAEGDKIPAQAVYIGSDTRGDARAIPPSGVVVCVIFALLLRSAIVQLRLASV